MPKNFVLYKSVRPNGHSKKKRLLVPAGFQIKKFGSLYLTSLGRSKLSRWSDSSRILRSLAYDRDLIARSVGLPKFFDFEKDSAYADRANAVGYRAWIKYDGSLIIRSVVRGRVSLRTRNSLATSELTYQAEQWAKSNCPALLDPSWGEDYSLHFEYLNPKRQLVIPIEREELVLLGGVNNQTLRLNTPEEIISGVPQAEEGLSEISRSKEFEINPEEEVAGLSKRIANLRIEGLVLRFDQGQKMLRVKTDFYRESSASIFSTCEAGTGTGAGTGGHTQSSK